MTSAPVKPAASPEQDDVSIEKSGLWSFVVLMHHAKGYYWGLAWAIARIMLASIVVLFSARTLGHLVDAIMAKTPVDKLLMYSAVIVGLEMTNVAMTYWGRVGLSRITNKIAYQIRIDLFRKISALPISYFDRQPLGRTITRLTSDVEGVEKFFSGPLARVLSAVISIASVMIAMLVTDIHLGSIVVLASLPTVFITFGLRGRIQVWLRLYKSYSSNINAKLAEYINGIQVIKIFGLEKWSQDLFSREAKLQRDAGIKLLNWNSTVRPIAALLCSMPMMVILWWGGQEVLAGTLPVGLVVAFVRYAERFYWPIMTISQEIHVVQEAVASSERVRHMLLEMEEEQVLGRNGQRDLDIQGDISFENVWMGYSPDRAILKGVSFHVRKGMTVALVGETGSGKTSTINLIPRLYPLQQGQILVDGVNIQDIRREALRGQIGMMSQDVIIFRGTLRENLLIACKRPQPLTDDELMVYCRQTGLDHVMRRLPKGLETLVIDGGENLSVGERQLIAFTRMLIRDPAIFILDEATANIDEECERLLQNAVHEVLQNRTCFVIAHRLKTILECDEILVFDQGEIIERGSHAELIARNGRYRQLAERQMVHLS